MVPDFKSENPLQLDIDSMVDLVECWEDMHARWPACDTHKRKQVATPTDVFHPDAAAAASQGRSARDQEQQEQKRPKTRTPSANVDDSSCAEAR